MHRLPKIPILLAPLVFGFLTTATADQTGSNMAEAARRFLATLDEKQKAQATFAFDSPERYNWHWITRARNGLPFKSLRFDQRALAFGLLATGVSPKGWLKATTIISLEEALRVEEQGSGPLRDPELYCVSVFGTPDDAREWGWRFEGHHISLNFTLRGGRVVSATPFAFGSNPAEVRSGPRKGLRNLAEFEDPANALLHSLTAEQRKAALVSETPLTVPTAHPAQPQATAPAGIPSDQLDPSQRETLLRLVQAYTTNFNPPIGINLLHQITRDDQTMHFAWYGPADPAQPHSFRIQGATFTIDFDDTLNGANHIHTYFRSLRGDFGMPAGR